MTANDGNNGTATADFVLTVEPPLSVADDQLLAALRAYPNPTSGAFAVELSNDYRGKVSVTLTDLSGRVVSAQSLDKQGAVLSVPFASLGVPSGLYLLQVTTNGATAALRVSIGQ